MQKHNIVAFIGHHSPFGLSTLKCLLDSDLKPGLVVLATEKRWELFRSSLLNKKSQTSYKYFLQSLKRELHYKFFFKRRLGENSDKVKLIKTNDINGKEIHKLLSEFKPTICIGAAFPQIFGSEILDLVEIVNLHPSLLPAYRGAHPHFWAIYKGEKYSGISAHKMVEKIDKGKVLAQVKIPIENIYYSEFYKRIIEKLPNLINILSAVLLDNHQPVLCNEDVKESYFRSENDQTCLLDFSKDDINLILNKIRTEKAYFVFDKQMISSLEAELWSGINRSSLTGDCFVEEGNLIVSCKGGSLKVTKMFGKSGEIHPHDLLKGQTKLNLID